MAAMALRPSLADVPFDGERFDALRAAVAAGRLTATSGALDAEVDPAIAERWLVGPDPDDVRRGQAAVAAGRVAVLVLAGGMAMRYGGGAKGAEPLLGGRDESFLWLHLRRIHRLARRLKAEIPAVVMLSFATRAAITQHLARIHWGGVPLDQRASFVQSVMPRVRPDGAALYELAETRDWPDELVFAAPGHGDTVARLRDSGVLARLKARGVVDLLIANVDNLGASLDPAALGRHLRATQAGASLSVEVVARDPGDRGGALATVAGRPIIVEGFRARPEHRLEAARWFNTNTLWCRLSGLERALHLDWFAVTRRVEHGGLALDVLQFEQLIGQLSERLPCALLPVDRAERFLPVKTREDLARHEPWIRARLDELA